jgi:hypothetical protein
MGLPSLGNDRPDISSDSDNESGEEDGVQRTPAEMAAATKQIAKMWLNKGRGNNQAQSFNAPDAASSQHLNISDDSGTDEENERPAVALSAQTQAIAKKWLSALRGPRQRDDPGDLSDDGSSSENDQNDSVIPISQATARIARLWLSNIRRSQAMQGRPAASVSSDDDSSDSGTDAGRQNGSQSRHNIPLAGQLAPSTRRIMALWMQNIRR